MPAYLLVLLSVGWLAEQVGWSQAPAPPDPTTQTPTSAVTKQATPTLEKSEPELELEFKTELETETETETETESKPPLLPWELEPLTLPNQLEPFARPTRSEEFRDLYWQLQSAGLPEAASATLQAAQESGVLPPTLALEHPETLFEPLVQDLLARELFSAADLVLDAWKRQQDTSLSDNSESKLAQARWHWYRAVLFYAQGNIIQAQRELLILPITELPPGMALASTILMRLAELRFQRQDPSLQINPFGIRWEEDLSAYRQGTNRAAQLAQLPSDAVAGLTALLRIMPRNGLMWAWLGEVFYLQDKPHAAYECMFRAEALGYNSEQLFRKHKRILEDLEAERIKNQIAALPINPKNPTATPAPDLADTTPVNNTRFWVGLIVGSIFLILVIITQIARVREFKREP